MQLFKTQCLHETANLRPARSYGRASVLRYGGRGTRQSTAATAMPATFVCGDNVLVGDFGAERAAWPQPRVRYERAA